MDRAESAGPVAPGRTLAFAPTEVGATEVSNRGNGTSRGCLQEPSGGWLRGKQTVGGEKREVKAGRSGGAWTRWALEGQDSRCI